MIGLAMAAGDVAGGQDLQHAATVFARDIFRENADAPLQRRIGGEQFLDEREIVGRPGLRRLRG